MSRQKIQVKYLKTGMVLKEQNTEYEILKFLDDRIQKNGKRVRRAMLKRYEYDRQSAWFGHIHKIEYDLGKYETDKIIDVKTFIDDQDFYDYCNTNKILNL
tara:strand:- start:219 stop:521 length:303 start_codon:yes stop_codon:yes gene_type:complete